MLVDAITMQQHNKLLVLGRDRATAAIVNHTTKSDDDKMYSDAYNEAQDISSAYAAADLSESLSHNADTEAEEEEENNSCPSDDQDSNITVTPDLSLHLPSAAAGFPAPSTTPWHSWQQQLQRQQQSRTRSLKPTSVPLTPPPSPVHLQQQNLSLRHSLPSMQHASPSSGDSSSSAVLDRVYVPLPQSSLMSPVLCQWVSGELFMGSPVSTGYTHVNVDVPTAGPATPPPSPAWCLS